MHHALQMRSQICSVCHFSKFKLLYSGLSSILSGTPNAVSLGVGLGLGLTAAVSLAVGLALFVHRRARAPQ